MLNYRLYLLDIKRAIESIEESVENKSYELFASQKDSIDSNAMRIQIIGESLKNLPKSFWKKSGSCTKELIDFRNIISHAYFKINSMILWDLIKNKIPLIKQDLDVALNEIKK